MYSYVVSETVNRAHHAPEEEHCKHPITWWHCSVVQLHCNKQPGPKYIAGYFVEQLSPKTLCKLCTCNMKTNYDYDVA